MFHCRFGIFVGKEQDGTGKNKDRIRSIAVLPFVLEKNMDRICFIAGLAFLLGRNKNRICFAADFWSFIVFYHSIRKEHDRSAFVLGRNKNRIRYIAGLPFFIGMKQE